MWYLNRFSMKNFSYFFVITALLLGCTTAGVPVNSPIPQAPQKSEELRSKQEKERRCQVSSILFTKENQCKKFDDKTRDRCLKELDKTVENLNKLLDESDSCHQESNEILDRRVGSK